MRKVSSVLYGLLLISIFLDNAQAATSTISLSSSTYSVAQNTGSASITVKRTGSLDKAARINYATLNSTAYAGVDYTYAIGTLRWAAGDATERKVSVPISNTSPFSGNKTFRVALSYAGGSSTLSLPSSATITINGSTALSAGTQSFSAAAYSVAPTAGTLNISVNRSGGSSGAVSVNYATENGSAVAGTDYTAKSGLLSWASGDTAVKSFAVPIANTSIGGKSFTVKLSAASGATIGSPAVTTITITPATIATWSKEAWSSAYQAPANLTAIWDRSPAMVAANGVAYYAHVNAWSSSASGFRYQKTWANNEHDWGVTSTHVNDGQVKSYSSIVRGWAIGEGVQSITRPIGIQIPNLTKVHLRWAFDAPSDYGGAIGANATNRVNVLWDTYFHTMSNPGPNDNPHTNLMINQYDVDGDGYYGGLAMKGQTVTLGGKQWQMHVFQGGSATGNVIEIFPGPYNDYKVLGTKDLTIDYLGVVKDLVAMGLIPATDYLTSIQAGYEVIAGGPFRTTQFWTAINNEVDGVTTDSAAGAPMPTVTLSANPTSITSGGSSTLTWNSTNATGCTATGAWAGAQGSSGSRTTGALAATSTYTLSCSGSGGTASALKTITVISAAPAPTPTPTVTLNASPASVTIGNSSTLTWSSTNATSCTATGAWAGAKTTSGSLATGGLTTPTTYSITCNGSGGAASASVTITINNTSTSSSSGGYCGGTSANVSWVYYNGAMTANWPFDYSWGGLISDYRDTSGTPLSGSYDIKVTTPIYAGWQPASLNWSFDVTGCNYLTFALKPTVANQKWYAAFLYVGDIDTNIAVSVTGNAAYGPANPVVGQWNIYKIPLSAFFPNGVVPSTIYKFHIQDSTGNGGANNVWYIDNAGFLGN
jgi:Calx-beta domain